MFGYLPQNLLTAHLGQDTSGLSPRVWSKLVGGAMAPDGDKRLILAGDDFTSFGGTVTSNVGTYSSQGGGYKSYEDTGDSIAQLATVKGGVIKLLTDTTDNDEVWIQSGYTQGVLGAISDTAGADHLTVFECRVSVGQITDTFNMFVGLGEEGLAAADTITDGGALASKDLIGFQILEADGDSIDFVYRKAGAAAVQKIAALQVPVADTYYKLGFVYDPSAPTSKRIAVYVDNVENSTYVTGTNIATATFPDGEELAFLMGLKNGAAAAKNASIDWWAFGQLIS